MTDDADKPATTSHTGRDTFRPVSVDDYFRRTVRDDHAPNAALHDAIKAAAEDDDRIASVNLMGSHAPGEKPHEPTYHVRVAFENGGMGEPSTGPTFVGRLMERGKVRCLKAYGGGKYADVDVEPDLSAEEATKKTIHDAVDRLTVHLRPVETRVEPVEVPVRDVPDRVRGVSESTVARFLGDVDTRLNEELRSVSAVGIFRDVMRDYEHALPDPDRDGADDRLQSLQARLGDHADGLPAVVAPDRDLAENPLPPFDVMRHYEALIESLEDLAVEYDSFEDEHDAPDIMNAATPAEAYHRAASDIRVALDDHGDAARDTDDMVEPEAVEQHAADTLTKCATDPSVPDSATRPVARALATVAYMANPDRYDDADTPADAAPSKAHDAVWERSDADRDDYEPSYNVTDVDGEAWSHDAIEDKAHALRIVHAILREHAGEAAGNRFLYGTPFGDAVLRIDGEEVAKVEDMSVSVENALRPPAAGSTLTSDGWEWEGPDDPRTGDRVGDLVDRAIERSERDFEPATTDAIESFRASFDPEHTDFPRNDVFDGFVPYSRRRAGKCDVHVAVQDRDDGSLVEQFDGKAGEWHKVDTGRGIWNVRVDVGASSPAAKPVTAYVCHGCERKSLPEDFFVPSCSCDPDDGDACDECGGRPGPRCPRCGTMVDWDETPGVDE